jgi:polyhydroxyalkanoate synthase
MATKSRHPKGEQAAEKPLPESTPAPVMPFLTKEKRDKNAAAVVAADERPLVTPRPNPSPVSQAQVLLGRSLINPQMARTIDRKARANLTRLTMGLSPISIAMDYFDWLAHLAVSPGKQARMTEKALRKAVRLGIYTVESLWNPNTPRCIQPLPQDKRFSHETWQHWPYNVIYQAFLLNQQWWHNATSGVRGVSKHNEQAVTFITRQLLDMWSPSNIPFLNPEITRATVEEGGANLMRGLMHFITDTRRAIKGEKPVGAEDYQVGRDLAVTPGKVVYRNRIMELVQYSPTTDSVCREPVLMLSAWMMKYYILDLSPHDSLVKYLVDRGHTVFMISWVNPGPEERDLSMDDYQTLGIMAALDAIGAIVPDEKVHAVGYCLGGILLTITAATMARDGDERLASVTLFTTMTDFTEVGEIGVFMGPSAIAFIEDMMWDRGYLEPTQASGGFQLLKSRDLIWSKMVREYFLGQRAPMFDLMAWNADTTRMPYRQHAELVRRLYRDNELVQGHYKVNDQPIVLSDIHVPIFAVAAERDHVAPWRSVYKLHLQSDACELTFVLASGGHNVGVISEPGHPRRSYQIATRKEDDRYIGPTAWQEQIPRQEGSWWPAWEDWLCRHSTDRVAPPAMGAPDRGYPILGDAPGAYVYQQ